MSNQPSTPLLLLLMVAVTLVGTNQFFRFAEGGQRRIHITDELDDVVDDEEDEEWKQWGKKPTPEFDPPPNDLADMGVEQIQEEMMKRNYAPVFGFAKLRLGPKRTKEMVLDIATKWSKLSRTGAIETKFTVFDLGTIMFTMQRGQDTLELKEFILSQPEAYELKMGDQVFRRPGDPPFELLLEKKLQAEKDKADNASPIEDDGHQKDEL